MTPLLLTAVLGCTDIESAELPTSSLKALVEARAWGDGSTAVGVDLKSRKALRDWVELTGDDALSASLAGDVKPMLHERRGRKHTYVAWFDRAPLDEEFTVRFERSLDGGAPDTRMVLPEPMEMHLDRSVIDLGWDGLEVTWSPTSSEPMLLTIEGSCISNVRRRISRDRGFEWISAGALEGTEDDWASSCEAVVELRRERAGHLDPAFRSGEALGVQVRNAVIYVEDW